MSTPDWNTELTYNCATSSKSSLYFEMHRMSDFLLTFFKMQQILTKILTINAKRSKVEDLSICGWFTKGVTLLKEVLKKKIGYTIIESK